MTTKTTNEPDGWLLNPDYEVFFDRVPAAVRAEFAGNTIAESTNTMVIYELGHAPMYYFRRADLRFEYLEASSQNTYCPYKGHASYWTVRIEDRVAENAIWTYSTPNARLEVLDGYFGFHWGQMDGWYEDGTAVPGPREIPGRIDTTMQLKKLFPSLAAEWHPTRNAGIKPYEFPPYSSATVWWRDADGHEWQAPIRERVIEATRLRTDGDANPYD